MQKQFALCRPLQLPCLVMKVAAIKVAIQGELGSFSHEAAERMLSRCTVVPCARSIEVFDRLQAGSVTAAVSPIGNSLPGTPPPPTTLPLTPALSVQTHYPLSTFST